MRILGVDPGLSGAVAVVDSDGTTFRWPPLIAAADIPLKGEDAKRRVDVLALADWISEHQPAVAFIERAGIFPKQGRGGGFRYGRAVGALEAAVVLARIPLHVVEAASWKRHFKLTKPEGADKPDKSESLNLARRRLGVGGEQWLAREKDHNRAEAIMIAVYGDYLIRERKVEHPAAALLRREREQSDERSGAVK